mmetsp:Transcript_97457/g.231937  ORF Transcript_97457/g.231937 Transcript_97457/m.231937 type:complete len:292 (-) Transcript_97457:223-1098(-)
MWGAVQVEGVVLLVGGSTIHTDQELVILGPVQRGYGHQDGVVVLHQEVLGPAFASLGLVARLVHHRRQKRHLRLGVLAVPVVGEGRAVPARPRAVQQSKVCGTSMAGMIVTSDVRIIFFDLVGGVIVLTRRICVSGLGAPSRSASSRKSPLGGKAPVVAACRRGRRVRPDWAALQLQGCVSRTGARADWNQVVVVPLSLKVPVLAPIVERCCTQFCILVLKILQEVVDGCCVLDLSNLVESKVTVEMPVDGCGLRRRREDGDRGQETEEAQQEQRKVLHQVNKAIFQGDSL